ncbi:unnamed protein product [Symbiodinium sp. CCMP2592]|nr:unnamed protein product [Symbiodinium sp. CCMP2592]
MAMVAAESESGKCADMVFSASRGEQSAYLLAPCQGCGSFANLVRNKEAFVSFMRQVLHLIEKVEGHRSYHLRVSAGSEPSTGSGRRGGFLPPLSDQLAAHIRQAGFSVFVFTDSDRKREPSDADNLLSLDALVDYTDASGRQVRLPITSRDITLRAGAFTRCVLDAQGRPILVVVPNRCVQFQSECSDDELAELWSLALDVIDDQWGQKAVQDVDQFESIRLNAGSFQNVRHLHLKVWMSGPSFQAKWASHPGYQVLAESREKRRSSLGSAERKRKVGLDFALGATELNDPVRAKRAFAVARTNPEAAHAWSTDESSPDEAGEDRFLFGEETRSSSGGYMKRRRSSRAAGSERSVPSESSARENQAGRNDRSSPHRRSLLESLTEGVANLWARPEAPQATPPSSRDSFQSTVLISKDEADPEEVRRPSNNDSVTRESLVEGIAAESQATSSQARRGTLFDAADLAKSWKRLSSDFSAGVASFTEALRSVPTPEASWRGARDHEHSSEAASSSQGDRFSSTSLDTLMNEAHLPFRQLLEEVPDPENTPGGLLAAFPRLWRLCMPQEPQAAGPAADTGDDATSASSSQAFGAQSPLFSAVVRARLVGHLLGCHEAVSSELTAEEKQLWDVFVGIDHNLAGSMMVSLESADDLCDALASVSSRNHAEACVKALAERVDDTGECDFADLLDVWEAAKQPDQLWQFRSSLRNGLSNLLAGAGITEAASSRVPEMRARCARLSDTALAMSAAAYQRALVLTCSWHCEQRLQSFLMTKGSPTERSRSEVKSLLAVLRGIHSELVPTERVLWELMGQQQEHFDGTVGKEEVLSALEELLGFHEEDARASPGELEELGRLRRQCQRRSVDNLFDDRGRTVVAFADVLRWWWDMPEEYREAAGLAVPASVLRQSLRRQPEEMFRGALRRVAAEPAFARQALRGHVRAFAELRALAVRRNIESFSIRSTAESRTTTSDAGDISLATSEDQADFQEEEDEASDTQSAVTSPARQCGA